MAAGIDINRLREASRANSAQAQHLARAVFGNWLAGVFPEDMRDPVAGRAAVG